MEHATWIKGKRSGILAMLAAAVLVLTGTPVTALADESRTDTYERVVNTQSWVSQTPSGDTRYSSYRSSDDEDDEDDERDDNRDEAAGPGAKSKVKVVSEETSFSGPKVQEISLSERYHEEYGVYEESLADIFFIYANVENGGITDQAVVLDIPANVSYTVQKDGVDMAYAAGQSIGAKGSYMFRFTGVDGSSGAFSEQTIYKATFRFRIQEKLPESKEEASEQGRYGSNRQGNAAEINGSDLPWGYSGNESESETAEPETTEPETAESEAAHTENQNPDAEESEAPVMDENGNIDEDALEAALNQALDGDESEAELTPAMKGCGIDTRFDGETGFYANELASGAVFYTNVPNGMVTNYEVSLRTSDDISFTVYRDGEAVEYKPGEDFEESGSYTIVPTQSTTAYVTHYGYTKPPVFQFRIITHPVNDLGVINAPGNMVISRVMLDGTELSEDRILNRRTCFLSEDGEYNITMLDEGRESNLLVTRDTVQPRFRVGHEPNRAAISYLSPDVVRCSVYKDGKLISDRDVVSAVEGSGDYTVQAYDVAGNMGYSSFSVSYQLNTGAIVAILILIVVVLAFILAMKRIRKKVVVR